MAIEIGEDLRRARTAEAAHFEAVATFNDAKSLRLQVLKDELAGLAAEPFELVLTPGDTPRLWIDLITSVVMEPDPKTYRMVQDGQGVIETTDAAEMVQQAKRIMAHGVIAQTRKAAVSRLSRGHGNRYSAATVLLAGGGGFAFGAVTLLALLSI